MIFRGFLSRRGLLQKATVRSRQTRPRFEALESRCTPATLPAGFSEAAVTASLVQPTTMAFAPDGRLFVLEQTGNVELVRPDGSLWTAIHLNVAAGGERGLLGIAFDPNYASNHFVYLYYTNSNSGAAPWATGVHNQLSRFTVDDSNPFEPLLRNETAILDWNSLSSATNHNGGAIHFGLDGMLYADAGDNVQTFTQGAQTYRVSQSLSTLLGKQLRIDVGAFNSGNATRDDTAVGHLIPADNPFVGNATGINQLIYALGLRNPFDFAVQPGTGKIFINDVGENTWEEIDQSVAGANFGWSGGNTDGFGQTPPGPGTYHDPLLAYNHSGGPAGGGEAIVGGTFYNPASATFPSSYVGKYFYADLSGWIRVFDPAHPGSASNPDTSAGFASGISGGIVDVKTGPSGSLYYLTAAGVLEKVVYDAPQITAAPVALTVNAGQSATFNVVASGPALSYQWQHLVGANWTNVGTNANSVTIASATAADAGSYRVIVGNSAGNVVGGPAVLTVNQTTPILSPGLYAEFFDYTSRLVAIPDLNGRTPDITRIDARIGYAFTRRPWAGLDARFADTFAVRETGFITINTAGRYRFALSAKDGARLYVDGNLVVNNDGIHPPQRRAAAVLLTPGLHAIRVEAFANTGLAGLVLSWSGPRIRNQVIPAARFFH